VRPIAALLGASLLFSAACRAEGAPDTRPNVLLIVIDTLRADHLGAYGFPHATSPRIDALAAEGVVFERAIAASSSTVPSHAALMSSKHVREINAAFATGLGRMEEPRPLALLFREAGYRTGAFVSNYVLQRKWGFAVGFDRFDDELTVPEPNRPKILERLADDTTRRALDWLAEEDERPFFAWVHYQDPHGPYAAPAPHAGRFSLAPAPGEHPLPLLPGNTGRQGIPRYQAVDGERRPHRYRSRYADEILYADGGVGALLDALESHPSGRPFVVLLTSDHGESFGEEGRWFVHGYSTTPQVAHVPMILRAPGLEPGRRADPVGHVDVLPTLLELAGLAPLPDARGLPLGPYLREGRPLPERWLFCDIGKELSAYRGDGFVRVTGVGKARKEDGGRIFDVSRASWTRYTWTGGDRWKVATSDADPDPGLVSYLRRAVPPREMELDAQTREHLRALGYLEE
jgi:arylsulfatase